MCDFFVFPFRKFYLESCFIYFCVTGVKQFVVKNCSFLICLPATRFNKPGLAQAEKNYIKVMDVVLAQSNSIKVMDVVLAQSNSII